MTITIQMSDFNEFFLTNHFRPEEAEFLGRPTRIAWLRIELLLESLLEALLCCKVYCLKFYLPHFFEARNSTLIWQEDIMFFEELFKVLLFQKWATLQLPALRLYDGHFSMNFHFHQIQFGFQDFRLKWLIIWVVFWSQRGSPVVSPAEVANCFRGF